MTNIIIAVLTIACGCFICFAGYNFFRLCLGLLGGALGYIAGSMLSVKLAPLFGENEGTAKIVIICIFTLLFGALAFWLYLKVLIIAASLYVGWWVFTDYRALSAEITTGKSVAALLVGIAAGALIGIAVYYAQKWTISLFTALVGARIISSVITPVLYDRFLSSGTATDIEEAALGTSLTGSMVQASAIVVLVFTVIGFSYQLKNGKKK